VLLAVAFSAILRVKVIADAALGVGFARTLLIVIALASLLLAATALLGQRDYKRMLAYSSIEHMALLALGAAAGSHLAMAAVLLHMLGHGLVKSSLFLSAGHILQATATSSIAGVRALLARAPALAGCFGVGIVALIGFPPFSVFASELAIARAGAAAGLGPAVAAAFTLVVVIAAALLGHTSRMLLGAPGDAPGAATAPVTLTGRPDRAQPATAIAPIAAALALCAVLGIGLGPLSALLDAAATVVTGAP
jgi:hydrogenase-4 component F